MCVIHPQHWYIFTQTMKQVHIPFALVSFEGGAKTACAAFDYP